MSTNKDDYNHLGLTDSEVLQSREKNGINLLTPPKRPSLWKLYLEKFEDPVVRFHAANLSKKFYFIKSFN